MNILVTGVSKGLGISISEVLLKNGWTVYGISRSKTKELIQLIDLYPDRFFHLSYDLSDAENVKEIIFKNWIGKETIIHGFVNNAAFAYDDIITNLNIQTLEKLFKTNVFTPFNITKYIIRQFLLHQVKGSIIHISSISVHTGFKGLSFYASSKGALEAFSKNTAREWGELGIRSNCIVAGFMETDMSAFFTQEQKNKILKRTSLKSFTDKQSVAETIRFLISEEAKSITAQNIHVDAGVI